MEKSEFKFTKSLIESIPAAPAGKRVFYRDTVQRGLQIRVTENGIKTFFVRRRVKNGADERVTLGRFPTLTVEQARAKASTCVAELANGRSVVEIKRLERGELTFGKLFEEYITRHAKPNKRTWDEDQTKYDQYLKRPLGSKKLSKVDRREIAAIHSSITAAGHGATANRVLALISSVFGKAIEWGHWDKLNPCTGISRNREKKRDRFLQADELPRFFAALAVEPSEMIRDYLNISLLTGARRSNVLAMQWREVNFGRAEWRIERTKNGESQVVTLAPEAVAILTTRLALLRHESQPKSVRESPFVFPSYSASGHLEEPKKGWRRILERGQALGFVRAIAAAEEWPDHRLREVEALALDTAEIVYERYEEEAKRHNVKKEDFSFGDLRIHDLRRTLGSWQAKMGASLSVIGKSLNHKNVASTAIYARLDQDPVRQSVNSAATAMLEAAGVVTSSLTQTMAGPLAISSAGAAK